ncbi:GNAT family N-acetyltransferase [Agromyces sp. LHK192]|uniref:GNAT family N-acetyltransferase n=1 Tax=Agromyces sp. LHK192 TaxID=2498704 RepID=UPI000FD916A6|nr:GNAT family N-acetyltransferase [Agromyces sp. LHK192]
MLVELEPWGPGDRHLLDRANTPEMTRYLGGPETDEQLADRQERYLRGWREGTSWMFRIVVDGEPAGGIGWWPVEHDGVPAYETGWNTMPEFQGRGVGREALRQVVRRVAALGDRELLVAYPGVDNPGSNALCRSAGFEHVGGDTMPWRGGTITFNTWVLDLSPLDLAGREPDLDERFDGGLDPATWWPHYTPHWSSRERSAARWTTDERGLELRIDADTEPWAPEWDGDVRVSHVQTGKHSGAVGTATGQHRFRDGLVVREAQSDQRLHLVHHGVIEVRMAAIRHPAAMVACWPIGYEERPDDCGEICIAEIFGSELDDGGGLVGVGVKPQRDPRLHADFEKVRVDGDLTEAHDYAVEWEPHRLRFFIDGRWVKTVVQSIDYPVQLMLDVYELPSASAPRDTSQHPLRFRVERVRTFPPLP